MRRHTGLQARIARWARRRHGRDAGPITLTSRRLYILPTGSGLMYGLMLVAVLLAGLNYMNNLVLALTFLLAGVGWVALHRCHANLSGLVITPCGASAPYAGDPAGFHLRLNARKPCYDLLLCTDDRSTPVLAPLMESTANNEVMTTVVLPTRHRGQVVLKRLRIESTYPLGLFRTWTWLHPDSSCLVYPRPRPDEAPPVATEGSGTQAPGSQSMDPTELADLRPFRSGDAPKHIVWKILARNDKLVTREFKGSGEPLYLDLATTPGADLEEKLSRLTYRVLDAHTRGERWALRLSAAEAPTASGEAHLARCLAMLATHELPPEPIE